jgi:hypothetical protein
MVGSLHFMHLKCLILGYFKYICAKMLLGLTKVAKTCNFLSNPYVHSNNINKWITNNKWWMCERVSKFKASRKNLWSIFHVTSLNILEKVLLSFLFVYFMALFSNWTPVSTCHSSSYALLNSLTLWWFSCWWHTRYLQITLHRMHCLVLKFKVIILYNFKCLLDFTQKNHLCEANTWSLSTMKKIQQSNESCTLGFKYGL